MTEYWVSQAKYHCKYCNVWMQDNKLSRSNHDNGVKHKERVEQFNKKKRDEKFHGLRSEQELRKQMDMIERAAREAMAADRVEADGAQAPAPPPGHRSADQEPVPRPGAFGGSGQWGARPQDRPAAAAQDDLRQDSSGTYTVRGVTYYEGQFHEDKLRTGVECEIFVEAEDEWLPARISARKEFPIPYTDKMRLVFDVKYSKDVEVKPSDIDIGPSGNHSGSPEAAQQIEFVVEREVSSDRLRLMEAADGSVGEAGLPAEPLPQQAAPVEENTGLGLWQTVSVHVVNEEEERQRAAEVERALEEERIAGSAGRRAHAATEAAESAEAGDVLKAYDPYNRGMYKGIKVSRESTETEIESLAKGKPVAFKKRKVNSGAAVAVKKSSSDTAESKYD